MARSEIMFRPKQFILALFALAAFHPALHAQTQISIKLKTGVRMSYVEQGNVKGMPVVLLHGLTDSLHSYDLVLPHLPASWHVFALSLRGHGDSSRPASGYTPRAFAADVAAFLDARKIPRAVIVGHSMGSAVAQRFAIDYPTRTQMLVLAGSFTTVRGHAGVQEFWDTTVAKLRDPIDPQIARGFQESTIHQPLPSGFLELAVNESLKVPARVWRAALSGLMQADHRAELKRINAPTLIVWGEKETYFLRHDQDALTAAIKGSRLVIWPDAGHALHWEHPQRFAHELINFIEKGE
jgi:pimeloyl-ACP methyl ester carboxylesterase